MRLKCENVGKVTRFYKMNEKVEIDNEIIHVYVVGGDEVNTDLGYIKLEITDTEAKHFAEDESEYCDATKINEHDSEHSFPIETEIAVVSDPGSSQNEDTDGLLQLEVQQNTLEDETEELDPLDFENGPKRRKMHTCNVCAYTTRYKNNLRRHLSSHFKPKGLRCVICKKPMESNAELKQHVEIHRCAKDPSRYKCNVCSYTSNQIHNVSQHTMIHYRPKEERFKCDRCRFVTKNSELFKDHTLKNHARTLGTKCPVCHKEYKRISQLRNHLQIYRSPQNPSVYQCKECPYNSKSFTYFKRHVIIHRSNYEVETFQCPHCPFATKRKTDLNQHVLAKHKTEEEVILFNCDFCSYKSKTAHLLTCHMKSRHQKELVVKQCGLCSFKTISNYLINKHVFVHSKTSERNFFCSECDFGCESQNLLYRHIRLRHKKDHSDTTLKTAPDEVEKSNNTDDNHCSANTCNVRIEEDRHLGIFCCLYTECDFKSSHERDVKIHKTICHNKQGENNKCTECTFHTTSRFTYLEHLKVHGIDIEHLKPYYCSVCGSRWIRKSDLTRHMSVHWNAESNSGDV